MKRTGFIGYGNMGSIMLKSLLVSEGLKPSEVMLSTRTSGKLKDLLNLFPSVQVVDSNDEVAKNCKRIFICVRTGNVKEVLESITNYFMPNLHLIIISAGLEIANVEKLYAGQITKIIPSMTCEVYQGYTLVCHNQRVRDQNRIALEKLLASIGKVKVITEDHFEVGADPTSCAPAFIASIFHQFVTAGVRHSRFTHEEAVQLVNQTLLGTAQLFCQKGVLYDELISRVATKGGITEEGLKILDRELPKVFDELFNSTLAKHEFIKGQIQKQYQNDK